MGYGLFDKFEKNNEHINLEKTHSGRPLGGESQNDGFGVMSLQM